MKIGDGGNFNSNGLIMFTIKRGTSFNCQYKASKAKTRIDYNFLYDQKKENWEESQRGSKSN